MMTMMFQTIVKIVFGEKEIATTKVSFSTQYTKKLKQMNKKTKLNA